MSLILSGTDGLSDVDGTAATPAIRGTDANTGVFFPAADTIAFAEGGAEVARFDSAGDFGLGVTPSANTVSGSGYRQIEVGTTVGNMIFAGGNEFYVSQNVIYNSGWKYAVSTLASQYRLNGGRHEFYTAPTGTAGNTATFTQAMTLDANGSLVVGGTTVVTNSGGITATTTSSGSIASTLAMRNTGTANGSGSYLTFRGVSNASAEHDYAYVAGVADDTTAKTGSLRFSTTAGSSPVERVRITSSGYLKASDTGGYLGSGDPYHELRQSNANNMSVVINCTNASYDSQAVQIRMARNTTNDTFYVLRYYNDGAVAYKFNIADSGNVTNTNGSYGAISDVKMKTDIVDANSQWEDIKAIRFRKYKMKDDPSGLLQLGVIAQELEQTSPNLISEHKDVDGEGVDLGTTTKSVKTSVLFMKSVKALQEAMVRIEEQQALITQLTARITALETA